MLYNQNIIHDQVNTLDFIQSYAYAIGVKKTGINTTAFSQIFDDIAHEQFPCVDGVSNASIFKKASVFVIYFLKHSPIPRDAFQASNLMDDLRDKDPNALIALNIALRYISEASVVRSNEKLPISEGIALSNHSYCDFVDMLTKTKLRIDGEDGHFMLLTLLFEQLTYKTNPHLQYPDSIVYGIDNEEDNKTYVPATEVEDPTGWNDKPQHSPPSYDQPGFNDSQNY